MIDYLPGSAWDAWRSAGAKFRRECESKQISIVELGEAAHQYAASRGLPNQHIIRRAFYEGYFYETP